MELWRPKSDQQMVMRPSKPNAICKKHPKHQQSPGVCSICLSEKLSQLSKNSRSKKNPTVVVVAADALSSCSSLSSLSSSSPSQCSSCASSACSSPVQGCMASEMRSGSLIFSRAGRNLELIKSRSMAAVTRRNREREEISDRHSKKKSNFWSKLLRPRPRGKRMEEAAGLVHSRTMREMLATTAH